MAQTKTAILTPRQREIYEFLKNLILNRGYGPTVREIGYEFGIRSPNGVMCHLKALEKKGLITREAHMSRAIQLTEKPRRQTTLLLSGEVAGSKKLKAAAENSEVDFSGMFGSADEFCLKVADDSFKDDKIAKGDHLIARRQQTFRNGDLVCAVVNGKQTVVRRYHQDGTKIRLESLSGSKAIQSNDVDVIGVVIGVIRRF